MSPVRVPHPLTAACGRPGATTDPVPPLRRTIGSHPTAPRLKEIPDMPSMNHAPAIPAAADRARNRRPRRALTASAVGLGAFMLGGGALASAGPAAFASSSAPTHGRTTCAVAGDECTNAVAYANANDGGGARVLAVEADTEAHGGAVRHRVFDIRMATKDGVYDLHVYRNDRAPYNDALWWQHLAENQNPSGGSGG
ncbi:MAG TPA: hypothetical protein VFN60_05110, partial [Acidimicrobiales bacterium]|nr:hypothetical protein [Acidimicrobiales bacterium]